MVVSGEDTTARRPPRPVGLQAVLLAGATGIAQVLVAVIYILTARDTDPARYGTVVTAIAIGTSVSGLIDFGSNALWTREAASGRMTTSDLGRRVAGKMLAATAVAVIGSVVLAFIDPLLLPAGVILATVLLGQTMLVPLRAHRRGETVALLLLLERAIAVILFLALLLVLRPTEALWISLAVGTLGLTVCARLLTPPSDRMRFFAGRPENPWAGTRHFGTSAIAASAQQLDLPLLGAVAGPVAAGLYGAVNRWTQPLQLLSGAFSSAAAPFLAQADGWGHARRIVVRASWMLFLAVAVCIGLAVFAPVLVPFLLGDQYEGSAVVLQWLALGTIPAIFNQPLASALQARRYDHLVAIPWLTCVIVQLGLVAVLGPLFGALGAAIAFSVLQTLLLVALCGCLIYAVRAERGSADSSASS